MATGKGLICKLGQHIPIEGADRIVQVNMFGETVITQKDNVEGTIGILFDMETCLSHEYASKNNMYRHSHLNEDKTVVGYLEDDRRIRGVRLKGVKCSALFMPISLNQKPALQVGQEVDELAGVKICEKYIPKATRTAMSQNKGGLPKQNLVPTFKEHIETDQWGRNFHKVQEGDLVIVTEKLHGTSGRCGYLPVLVDNRNWFEKLMSKLSFKPKGTWDRFINEYHFVVGSRRVVKSIGGKEAENKKHYYSEDLWTKISKEHFEGKLRKGETVYFEIVGYTPTGENIMSSVSNKKLEKFLSKEEYKEFIQKYGETTHFTYGCINDINQHILENNRQNFYKVFVYRITMTNEDGDSVDYSWEQVKKRCEKLGVDYVPELAKFVVDSDWENTSSEYLNGLVQNLTNLPSDLFPQHIREGVCIRIENGSMNPYVLKNKSFIFKVLEGIVKDSDVIDREESN